MGFFKKAKTAIVNFEGYQQFANEQTTKTIKYFLQIVLVFVIFASISVIYPLINTVKQGVEYMKTDIPNFSIKDNKLTMESEEPVTTKNEDMSLIICLGPKLTSDEVNAFFEENKTYNNVAVLAGEQFFVKMANTSGTITYDYNTITQTLGIQELSKQTIIDYFDTSGYIKLFSAIFLFMLAYLLLTYIIVTLLDALILSLLALITAKLYKVNLNYRNCFNMAIYALTLPILLNAAYVIINAFTGFKIEYFQIMYNVISYIYIIAAILIIKTDFNKTGSDVIKIVEELKKQETEEMPIEEPNDKNEKDKENKSKKDEKAEKDDGTPEPNPGKA